MAEFKTGQRVKVEYEGTVVSVGAYSLMLKMDGGQERAFRIDAPELKVTLLDPADWPPQVGDIWEAEGREWYTRQNMACGDEIIVGTFDRPSQDYYQRDLDGFKALSPVLVRRRGQ